MSEYDYPEEDLETEGQSLADQLGSGSRFLAQGVVDMRKLTYLCDPTSIPKTFKHALYWTTYNDVINEEKDFSEAISDNFLHLLNGIRGRGQRMILQAETVKHGGTIDVRHELEKPNILARNLWNRDWEEKQKRDLDLID